MKIICDREEVTIKTLSVYMDKTEQEVLDFIENKDVFEYDEFLFKVERPIEKKKRLVTNIVATDESCKGKIVYFDGIRTSKHEISKKLNMSIFSFYHVLKGKKSFDINGHKIYVR